MAALSWTAEAERSLREIHDHIAQNRPATATRTIESIVDRVESLRDHPDLGQPYDQADGRAVRRLTHGRFQVAYLVEDGEVVVLGVFHGLIFLPLQSPAAR